MTIKAHVDAVVGLLSPTVTVYVTRASDGAVMPYVVLHPDMGSASATALTAASDARSWRFQTTIAASGWEQAVTWAQKVETALLDVRPSVASRKCTPIRKEVSLPIGRDEDMPTPVFMARDTWTLSSYPA